MLLSLGVVEEEEEVLAMVTMTVEVLAVAMETGVWMGVGRTVV